MTTFCKNLKRFRLAKNYTQEQAAQALGVSTQSVSRWECGTTLPDVTILPQISRLYCVTVDDLYQETSVAYDNYAHRLGSVYEATREPEDFLGADMEYRKILKSGEYTTEDLRLYGILHQYMMEYCIQRAVTMFDRVLERGADADEEVYWRTMRQKMCLLHQLGRNDQSIARFLGAVESGSGDRNDWICLIAAYQNAEQHESAWEWFQRAQKRFPEDAMLCCYGGWTCAALGRYEEAFDWWDKTLALDPEFTDAMYAKGECYEELGNFRGAYEIWTALADDLARRGYDSEQIYPRQLAKRCRERMQEGTLLY